MPSLQHIKALSDAIAIKFHIEQLIETAKWEPLLPFEVSGIRQRMDDLRVELAAFIDRNHRYTDLTCQNLVYTQN